MNGNSRNHDSSDDENLFSIQKTTYWEIYGVKRFPYRGKRKFTPLLYQSLDGVMVISNDVFGLTISQFERVYKACLERRKTKEQWILNLRYPDKSSREYLEHLENCKDNKEGNFLGIDSREKYLYEHLVQTVGSEIDIRTRQRLFIIQDRIINSSGLTDRTQIFSGSLAEGLDLPGSDMDVMFVINNLEVIHNLKNIKKPIHRAELWVVETDIDHPGFARLRAVSGRNGVSPREACMRCPPGTCTGTQFYLSVKTLLDEGKQDFSHMKPYVHGPCITDRCQTIDIAYCIRSKYLPHNATPWASRHRRQWPSKFVIDRIIKYGCLLVPIGPKTLSDSDYLWRISFSVAEKILVHSFNSTQLLCYGLLKLTLKCIVNTNNDVKELLCSYFLKTALFWVSEETDIDTFQLSKLFICFSLCLDKLMSWVNTCYCPNYFIPEHNMFIGKINQINNKILLCVLESIKFGGIDWLINSLFLPDNGNPRFSSTYREYSSIMLDFLFFRIKTSYRISSWKKRIKCTETLLKSESSTFLIGVCTHHYAGISKHVAQLLPHPNTIGTTYNMYNIRKCYHRALQNGIKTDAVSGWLLYASFYYATGQFKVTLRLTDFVLSRCSSDMVFQCDEPRCRHRIMYRQNIHSSMTLNDRMRMAILRSVRYCMYSSLIPEELQMEVEKYEIGIPPVVMSHCLRFLCYHHLGDIVNRQLALRDLYLTVKDSYLIQAHELSDSITILGVCYEISGAKDKAYQCYEEALQVDGIISSTAQIRKSKLDGSYC
ncbi:uncharacterized protein LOC127723120 [Mytilus californianus]|uniref:uncharacterized protein LOC127723120 n=1 Tax=Mytilus californianus TaxID=6549 RepID=UPI002245393C|nr:uncharacterized protein LOC127723120 [Mytilus californianus]XP_052085574.1 uncharacterized protein LOC127723120 [Mytilus californianus]